MNYFNKFIKEEYEWLYWENTDSEKLLLEQLDNKFTDEEFEQHFDIITTEAMLRFVNNDYIVETIHDLMYDEIYNVMEEFVANKEEFIDKYKITEEYKKYEKTIEILEAYELLSNNANTTEEILKNKGYVSKETYEIVKEINNIIKTTNNVTSINITLKTDDGNEYDYEFIKPKKK